MRVFIDYCINNPILTAILIISAVAMLLASGFLLAMPNAEEKTEMHLPLAEISPLQCAENNDTENNVESNNETSNETKDKQEKLLDEKLFHELPIDERNTLEASVADEDDGYVDFDYEYEEKEPRPAAPLLDAAEQNTEKDADTSETTPIQHEEELSENVTTKKTAKTEKSTKVSVKEKKSKSVAVKKAEIKAKTEKTPTADDAERETKEITENKTKKTSKNAPETKTEKKARVKKEKTQKPQEINATTKSKEPIMLLDELKDVDNEIDFYEEDETDRMARYKGKWVICRVVTEEHSASNVKNDEDELYFFELHASNGEKLLSSEEVYSYNSVLRGIETHKANILRGNFKITVSKKGEYVFKLRSGKNLLLCMGENYTTRAACENAIESAKRFAKTAIIDENIQDHVVKVPKEEKLAPLPLPDECVGKWIISERKGVDEEPLYFFELFTENGEKLLSSEEYTTYIGAVNGIHTHKSNIQEGNFSVTLTKRGDYTYKLLNKNGQLLCLGEHYRTKRHCLSAVEAVKRYAKQSPILTSVKNKL